MCIPARMCRSAPAAESSTEPAIVPGSVGSEADVRPGVVSVTIPGIRVVIIRAWVRRSGEDAAPGIGICVLVSTVIRGADRLKRQLASFRGNAERDFKAKRQHRLGWDYGGLAARGQYANDSGNGSRTRADRGAFSALGSGADGCANSDRKSTRLNSSHTV